MKNNIEQLDKSMKLLENVLNLKNELNELKERFNKIKEEVIMTEDEKRKHYLLNEYNTMASYIYIKAQDLKSLISIQLKSIEKN
ncbi:MAG: hypothetical protein ACRDD7_14655 [Peptostreptococcaceae bacterium]